MVLVTRLSAIKKLYDGSIIAYQVGHYNDNPLVMNTLKEAIEANPNATPLYSQLPWFTIHIKVILLSYDGSWEDPQYVTCRQLY